MINENIQKKLNGITNDVNCAEALIDQTDEKYEIYTFKIKRIEEKDNA